MADNSEDFDLLIHGGCVIDGTKAPRFDADVGIRGDRITAIGDLGGRKARQRLDAGGKIVAPGFIDAHTHDDQAVLGQPGMGFKVSQGVTTVITGNCGISIAPLAAEGPLPSPLDLLEGEAGRTRFADFGAYFAQLEATPASVNVAALVGHSSLRATAMAALDRPALPAEIEAMRALLQAALDAGAIGLSTGTAYPPAMCATTEEIIAVARPLSAAGGLYATHMRNENDEVIAALDETFRIGRELGVAVVISHHKVQNPPNFGRSVETLRHIAAAMAGQCVGLDCYPYDASSTMIRTEPAWLACRMLIASSVPHPECAGRDLDAIAREWGVDKAEAARRLQPGSAIYFQMDEADVQRILAFEATMIGSDGIPLGPKPHPRLWGTFPRVLGHYSRELGLFPLETAVWKMTGLSARRFGLAGRGQLVAGAMADVVVFDPATVRDRANYDTPTAAAEGIASVIVNGRLTWRDGQHLGTRNGRVLRRQRQGVPG